MPVHLPPGGLAILLGLEDPQAAATVSSLAKAGTALVGISNRPIRRMRGSRSLREMHRPGPAPKQTLALLETMADRGGTIFPLNDEYLFLVSKNHEKLARSFVLTTPPWEILRPIVDQRKLYELARECGIKAPIYFTPSDEADLRVKVAMLDLERESFLLKTFWEAGPANKDAGSYTVIPPNNRQAIEERSLEILSRNGELPMIAQVIPGGPAQSVGVNIVMSPEHTPLIAYAVRRLKLHRSTMGGHSGHPFETGTNTYCETIRDNEAVEAAQKVLAHAGFTGTATVEFRRDSRDNSLTLVKVDPRLTFATSLSGRLNRDLPTATYRLFNGLSIEKKGPVRAGVQWMWLSHYLDALWSQRSNRPMASELFGLLRRLSRPKSLAYWDLRDPLPFILDMAAWGWAKVRTASRRMRYRLLN